LLPDTDPVAAERAAALLHAAVCRSPISTAAGPLLVTVSVGLAATTDPEADLNTLLTRADEALYEAKRAGRNRVAMSGLPVWSGLPIPSGLPVASGLPAQPRSGSGRPGGPAGSPSPQE
ncbi:MAG TPA: diguanylate cyclase, partial [Actinoplanes sp.]